MSHYEKKIQSYRERFGLDGIELEGEPAPKEQTLQDLIDKQEKDADKNYQMAFGSVRGKLIPFAFRITSKPR